MQTHHELCTKLERSIATIVRRDLTLWHLQGARGEGNEASALCLRFRCSLSLLSLSLSVCVCVCVHLWAQSSMRMIVLDTHARINELSIPDGDVFLHMGDMTRWNNRQ